MSETTKSLAEILRERREQIEGRTDTIDAAEVEAVEGTPAEQERKKKKKKKKVQANTGVGRDYSSENERILLQQIDSRIAAAEAAGNVDLVNRLKANREALLEATR